MIINANQNSPIDIFLIKDSSTSLVSSKLNYEFKVFPNPVNSMLHVQGEANLSKFRIIDYLGGVCLKSVLSDNRTIDTSQLIPGDCYIIHFDSKETAMFLKE